MRQGPLNAAFSHLLYAFTLSVDAPQVLLCQINHGALEPFSIRLACKSGIPKNLAAEMIKAPLGRSWRSQAASRQIAHRDHIIQNSIVRLHCLDPWNSESIRERAALRARPGWDDGRRRWLGMGDGLGNGWFWRVRLGCGCSAHPGVRFPCSPSPKFVMRVS